MNSSIPFLIQGKNEPRDVLKYFTQRLINLNEFPDRQVYVHHTTAISRSAMKATIQ